MHEVIPAGSAATSRSAPTCPSPSSATTARTATSGRAARPRRRRPSGYGGLDPDTGRPRKFAYPPQLVVVDGGPPQVAAAAGRWPSSASTTWPCVGLAKRLEEVWLPGTEHPVILPRTSEGLYLLQRVRDEAHRFAITFHRQRRSKTMTASALDWVPGLGETRRKALLRHFGSLKRVRAASAAEIAEVPGIGRPPRRPSSRRSPRRPSDSCREHGHR